MPGPGAKNRAIAVHAAGHALVASLLGVRVNRVSLTDEQPAAWVYERGDVATLFVRCYAPSVPHVTPGSQL